MQLKRNEKHKFRHFLSIYISFITNVFLLSVKIDKFEKLLKLIQSILVCEASFTLSQRKTFSAFSICLTQHFIEQDICRYFSFKRQRLTKSEYQVCEVSNFANFMPAHHSQVILYCSCSILILIDYRYTTAAIVLCHHFYTA